MKEPSLCLSIQGNVKVQGMGIFFLVMPPGPDLVYKESVYGVQPRNNVSLISHSNNVAPGQAWHAKHEYKELTYEIQ